VRKDVDFLGRMAVPPAQERSTIVATYSQAREVDLRKKGGEIREIFVRN